MLMLPNIPPIVQLNKKEMAMCIAAGKRRRNATGGHFFFGGETYLGEKDITGACGEFAFRKWMFGMGDVDVKETPKGLVRNDCVRNGWRVEIKSMDRPDGNLVIPFDHPVADNVDFIALARQGSSTNEWELPGFMDRASFYKNARKRQLKYAPAMFMAATELYSIKVLKVILGATHNRTGDAS